MQQCFPRGLGTEHEQTVLIKVLSSMLWESQKTMVLDASFSHNMTKYILPTVPMILEVRASMLKNTAKAHPRPQAANMIQMSNASLED